MGDTLHPELNFVSQNELVNLTTTMEDHYETGNAPDITMTAGKVKESLPLIRKFNRHSSLILSQKQTNPIFSSTELLNETRLDDLEKPPVKQYLPLSIPNIETIAELRGPVQNSKFNLQFNLKVSKINRFLLNHYLLQQ